MTTPKFLNLVIPSSSGSAVLYRLTSPSGAVYIGQTRNLKGRMANYRSIARGKGGSHGRHQRLLARSLLRYGFDAHRLDLLHTMAPNVPQEMLDRYEIYVIQMHKNMASVPRMMNCSRGGRGTVPHAVVRALSRPDVQGEKHPLAKLTESNVRSIRATYRRGSSEYGFKGLARKHGVSVRLICNVVKGEAWTHVK